MQAQLFTSASEDHYTPKEIAERIRYVFNAPIDLDPASCYQANQTIGALRYYADPHTTDELTLNDPRRYGFDGLRQPDSRVAGLGWASSTLWLNPPFTVPLRDADDRIVLNAQGQPKRQRVIEQWVKRWAQATKPRKPLADGNGASFHETAEAGQAAIIVPARTDTDWYQPLWQPRYRLAFIVGRIKFGEAENGAPFPSVIAYYGPNADRFYQIFEEIAACGVLTRK